MIYITGDTHSDFTRFSSKNFPEQKALTKADYVIICGDFGGLWDNSKGELRWLDWLNDKPFTTLFVDGNHENFDLLSQFPITVWNGGKVRFIRDSIMHLMRGQVYTIDDKRFFTMGGASSHDISDGVLEPDDPNFKNKRKLLDKRKAFYRINHVSWWAEEMPSEEEYMEARRNLDACDWKVDYIISHCCPSSVAKTLGGGLYQPDRLTDFFEEISACCKFGYWFFGHYHGNEIYKKQFVLLYEKIISIEALDTLTSGMNFI
jgi:predicted phosphodiesterase